MAQNDFISERYAPNDSGFGVSVLNSSLSNPITTSIQCRSIDPNNIVAGPLANHFWLKNPQYKNINFNKSISQRIWARIRSIGEVGGVVGLMGKHSLYNSVSGYGTSFDLYPRSGYEFAYRKFWNGGSSGARLTFYAGGVNSNMTTVELTGLLNLDNTWLGLRMDIIPVTGTMVNDQNIINSDIKDIVTCYTASLNNPNNWQQIYTTQIQPNTPSHVPWGKYVIKTTDYPSVVNFETDSYCGFSVRRDNDFGSRPSIYWDDYQIYVIDAF